VSTAVTFVEFGVDEERLGDPARTAQRLRCA